MIRLFFEFFSRISEMTRLRSFTLGIAQALLERASYVWWPDCSSRLLTVLSISPDKMESIEAKLAELQPIILSSTASMDTAHVAHWLNNTCAFQVKYFYKYLFFEQKVEEIWVCRKRTARAVRFIAKRVVVYSGDSSY